MFWNKKQPQEPKATIEACAHALYEALAKGLTKNGRIHVEDLISAAAAIVGEASIDAAGDFNPLSHEFAPGPAVSEFVTSKQVSITLQCRGAGSGGGSP
jgi:hypothetical protein